MICPNCKKESDGQWCTGCGFRLSSDDGSRSRIYDDDSVYPYETDVHQATPPQPAEPAFTPDFSAHRSADMTSHEDKKYSSEYDRLSELSDKMVDSGNKKAVIIVCSIIGGVIALAIIVAVIIMNIFGGAAENSEPAKEPETVTVEDDTGKLRKKATHYMDASDYESAEKIYKQMYESNPDDDEAYTLYTILFNFNKSTASFNEKDYADARKYMNKIPHEYESYDGLCKDIDYLDDELTKCENTYIAFEKAGDLIDAEEYEDASKELELVERKLLTSDDQKIYDDYRDIIDEKLNYESESENTVSDSPYGQLSVYDAEILINEYCNAMVNAINNNDFSIVAPYIHKSSEMYKTQKNLVSYYDNLGLTQSFDGVKIESFKRTGSASWDVSVKESETLYYADGTSESKSYNWTYTIESIDSTFYVTNIR